MHLSKSFILSPIFTCLHEQFKEQHKVFLCLKALDNVSDVKTRKQLLDKNRTAERTILCELFTKRYIQLQFGWNLLSYGIVQYHLTIS